MKFSRNLDRSFALTNRLRTEGTDPVNGMRETAAAMAYLDRAVMRAGGVVLRYGAPTTG